jgi:hypothetical protein
VDTSNTDATGSNDHPGTAGRRSTKR